MSSLVLRGCQRKASFDGMIISSECIPHKVCLHLCPCPFSHSKQRSCLVPKINFYPRLSCPFFDVCCSRCHSENRIPYLSPTSCSPPKPKRPNRKHVGNMKHTKEIKKTPNTKKFLGHQFPCRNGLKTQIYPLEPPYLMNPQSLAGRD